MAGVSDPNWGEAVASLEFLIQMGFKKLCIFAIDFALVT